MITKEDKRIRLFYILVVLFLIVQILFYYFFTQYWS